MTDSSYRRATCRLCNSHQMSLVVPLLPSSIADAYLVASRDHELQPLFPLDLYLCEACSHLQICEVVNPSLLFPADYLYKTGASKALVEHFRQFTAQIIEKLDLQVGARVIDIGSNDGTLLAFFKHYGAKVLGIDAAAQIAAEATSEGIPTIAGFFNTQKAQEMVLAHGQAKLVTANNVFAHSDELGEMARGIEHLLAPDGVFVFEVSYLVDIMDKMLFDTVYHEHLCYHAVKPLCTFLAQHGLQLFDVERIPTKGGSIRCFAQRMGASRPVAPIVGDLAADEDARLMHDPRTYRAWAAKIADTKVGLLALLYDLKKQGKRICGYGASATVTTLIHHFELAPFLDFLCDDNTLRHGMISPGYHLPIMPPTALLTEKADYCVLLAWQYAKPILAKNNAFKEGGGAFIIPLPTPAVLA